VLDTGSKLVTASADGNSRVYNTMTGACHAILTGHEGEISKVTFNPQGSRILTASSDKTARIWETETGDCLQVRRDSPPISGACDRGKR
jgi:dynein assembly factor with WDR repeat domains 1